MTASVKEGSDTVDEVRNSQQGTAEAARREKRGQSLWHLKKRKRQETGSPKL